LNVPEAIALQFLRDHTDWNVLLDERGRFLGLAAPGTEEYWQQFFNGNETESN